MSIGTMRQLFVRDLCVALDCEEKILESLPDMIDEVENPELKTALTRHLEQTEEQAENLRKVFAAISEQPLTIECLSMQSLAEEYQNSIELLETQEIKDLCTAQAAAKVEHLEIAMYRSLIALAEEMGNAPMVSLLQKNLDQEEEALQTVERFVRESVPVEG